MISHKNNRTYQYCQAGLVAKVVFVFAFLVPTASHAATPAKPCLGATIFPLFDLVRLIAGDRFEVIQLLPSGRSEHLFDPSPQDIIKVKGCRAFFAIGIGLDPWVGRLASASVDKGITQPTVIEVGVAGNPISLRRSMSAAVGLLEAQAPDRTGNQLRTGGDGTEALDPHVWLDPVRWALVAQRVSADLANIDPAGAKVFAQRGLAFSQTANSLHQKFALVAAKWRNPKLVSVHGAYGYFSLRYALSIPAVLELVPGRQPSAKYLAAVLATIRKERIKVVLAEPQIDQRMVRMITSETGARLLTVDPIGGLVPDDSWESMMTRFFDTLSGALQ